MKTSATGPQQDNVPMVHCLFWSEFVQILQDLSQRVQVDGWPQVIIGIQRGGLVPAVYLSHHLRVRNFLSLPMNRTTSDEFFADKMSPSIGQIDPELLRSTVTGKDVLVVDDIVGTGESIQNVFAFLSPFAPARLRSAICVVNLDNWDARNSQPPTQRLTYVGKQVRGWVVFPWEMNTRMES